MDHQAERTSEPRQLGGDRVDEEGHVIRDDLHDWASARPPIRVIGRRMHAHTSRAGGALTAQIDVRDHRTQEVGRSTRLEVLLRHVPVVEGGKLLENLKNRSLRGTMVAEMQARDAGYENLCEIAGPEGVMVVGFRTPELQRFEGKRLSEIAAALGTTWPEAIIDLNVAESLGLGEILFLMSEENMRLQLKQPWMKFGTDAGAQDPATARGSTHPRAYGNFPRIFRKYVREEGVLPLEDAVRKASSAVATRLSLTDRGVLKVGLKADVIVFDPATITDHATFEQPHQLSTGMRDVFVNGVAVVREGRHTGAKPGQVVRGPGYRP